MREKGREEVVLGEVERGRSVGRSAGRGIELNEKIFLQNV